MERFLPTYDEKNAGAEAKPNSILSDQQKLEEGCIFGPD